MIYKITYMHGDADGFSERVLEVKSNVKNNLIKFALDLYEKLKPDESGNFFGYISFSELENELDEESLNDEDLMDEAKFKLRENRARRLFNILREVENEKELFKKENNSGYIDYKDICKIISLNFNEVEDKDSFYDEIFDTCWDLICDEVFMNDCKCWDYFAEISEVKIQDSYYSDIIPMLDSLSLDELKNLEKEVQSNITKKYFLSKKNKERE